MGKNATERRDSASRPHTATKSGHSVLPGRFSCEVSRSAKIARTVLAHDEASRHSPGLLLGVINSHGLGAPVGSLATVYDQRRQPKYGTRLFGRICGPVTWAPSRSYGPWIESRTSTANGIKTMSASNQFCMCLQRKVTDQVVRQDRGLGSSGPV